MQCWSTTSSTTCSVINENPGGPSLGGELQLQLLQVRSSDPGGKQCPEVAEQVSAWVSCRKQGLKGLAVHPKASSLWL